MRTAYFGRSITGGSCILLCLEVRTTSTSQSSLIPRELCPPERKKHAKRNASSGPVVVGIVPEIGNRWLAIAIALLCRMPCAACLTFGRKTGKQERQRTNNKNLPRAAPLLGLAACFHFLVLTLRTCEIECPIVLGVGGTLARRVDSTSAWCLHREGRGERGQVLLP